MTLLAGDMPIHTICYLQIIEDFVVKLFLKYTVFGRGVFFTGNVSDERILERRFRGCDSCQIDREGSGKCNIKKHRFITLTITSSIHSTIIHLRHHHHSIITIQYSLTISSSSQYMFSLTTIHLLTSSNPLRHHLLKHTIVFPP